MPANSRCKLSTRLHVVRLAHRMSIDPSRAVKQNAATPRRTVGTFPVAPANPCLALFVPSICAVLSRVLRKSPDFLAKLSLHFAGTAIANLLLMNKTILVVDDDASVRDSVSNVLR